MRGTFGAEAIGLNNDEVTASWERMTRALLGNDTGDALFGDGTRREDRRPDFRPWCAEIVGRCPRFKLKRVFLRERRDYSKANSVGSRGVWFWWTLEEGRIYEVRYRETWNGGFYRKFLRVGPDGEVVEVSREEVEAWLDETESVWGSTS